MIANRASEEALNLRYCMNEDRSCQTEAFKSRKRSASAWKDSQVQLNHSKVACFALAPVLKY